MSTIFFPPEMGGARTNVLEVGEDQMVVNLDQDGNPVGAELFFVISAIEFVDITEGN